MEDFHPAQYNKAWVALLMAALIIIEDWTGWKTDFISEQGVTTVLSILTPLLVWLTPNRRNLTTTS